ncbi:hypothetical protein TRVL_07280 [Trypanosoma vivax]|nr:hypothetical protein TRVL_07280 [Trypanosoma vivax]
MQPPASRSLLFRLCARESYVSEITPHSARAPLRPRSSLATSVHSPNLHSASFPRPMCFRALSRAYSAPRGRPAGRPGTCGRLAQPTRCARTVGSALLPPSDVVCARFRTQRLDAAAERFPSPVKPGLARVVVPVFAPPDATRA